MRGPVRAARVAEVRPIVKLPPWTFTHCELTQVKSYPRGRKIRLRRRAEPWGFCRVGRPTFSKWFKRERLTNVPSMEFLEVVWPAPRTGWTAESVSLKGWIMRLQNGVELQALSQLLRHPVGNFIHDFTKLTRLHIKCSGAHKSFQKHRPP